MKAIIDGKALNRMIEATRRFVASDTSRAAHRYIRLDFRKEGCSAAAAALDGYRLSVERSICLEVDEDFTVFVKPTIAKCPAREEHAVIERAGHWAHITYGDASIGYRQPEGESFDYESYYGEITARVPTCRIAFNGEYLLSALMSAKASVAGALRRPVVLEFGEPNDSVLLRTDGGNIKVVLPIRIRGEDSDAL